MSNALAVVNEWTKDQLTLIKSTVAKGATDDELKLFLYRCRNMSLDPLKPGQIHFIKYGSSPGTIVIGIEGFRTRAAATGKHTGTKRGVIRDESGKCIGAWCEVYRSDWTQCAREEVALWEYNNGKAQWAKMPETMIKKVAEVSALRMAFPDELGGIYSDDEMDQAGGNKDNKEIVEAKQTTASEVIEVSTASPADYVPKFGKWGPTKDKKTKEVLKPGVRLAEIDLSQLKGYVKHIEDEANKKGQIIKGDVAEFMRNASDYIKSKTFPTIETHDEIPF